ncbi:Methane oxygenase PmoA [Geodermatophilus dictyosporus]|uniref:Methane oxygenase PmoA n=1 Tax=Geodermatophilus dictyosporus TaxID=1523247 RepID=A0A1I5JJ01_9ACTN|nr:PmoA family protein [Geodermatophilus dictyosporus]SFO72629.1 Methane oxygenase PmoA [Geodermatophilus dictyosporus]
MADRPVAVLRAGGVVVAEYRDGRDLDPSLAPRPYLHPVTTLGGVPVSDALPADHPWHLGVSVGIPDVGGANLWGGPTYLRDRGYTARADHGRVESAGFSARSQGGLDEALHWLGPDGRLLLGEHRRVRARPVAGGWELGFTTVLTNATGGELALGSPATNGRPGAGYGGFSWRLPPAGEPHVRTPDAEGEEAVHGSPAAWLAWTDRAAGCTVVLAGADDATRADPWFVRVADYPGLGSSLAARHPLRLPPGGTVRRAFRALVADGDPGDDAVAAWAGVTRVRAAPAPVR